MPFRGPANEALLDHSATWTGTFPRAECDEDDPLPFHSLQPGQQQNLHREMGELLFDSVSTLDSRHPLNKWICMRSRERILANLDAIYRESYDRAKKAADEGRMIDLEGVYMRDQLMLEILLDIRDLFSVAPAASGGSALEKLEAIRRLTKLR